MIRWSWNFVFMSQIKICCDLMLDLKAAKGLENQIIQIDWNFSPIELKFVCKSKILLCVHLMFDLEASSSIKK